MQHLAIIMDGNRRWALAQGFKPWIGHEHGAQAVKKVIEFCLEKKISVLSLYAFSTENLKRSASEQEFLFSLLVREAKKNLNDFIARGIKIRFVGDESLYPPSILDTITTIHEKTKQLNVLTINILFCYGGQQEIINAVKQVVHAVQNNQLSLEQLTPATFQNFLWTQNSPEPDLIIRTGGRQRLSNFLLYQAAYSEFYFLDCLWPDLTTQNLEDALDYYMKVTRNYGT